MEILIRLTSWCFSQISRLEMLRHSGCRCSYVIVQLSFTLFCNVIKNGRINLLFSVCLTLFCHSFRIILFNPALLCKRFGNTYIRSPDWLVGWALRPIFRGWGWRGFLDASRAASSIRGVQQGGCASRVVLNKCRLINPKLNYHRAWQLLGAFAIAEDDERCVAVLHSARWSVHGVRVTGCLYSHPFICWPWQVSYRLIMWKCQIEAYIRKSCVLGVLISE